MHDNIIYKWNADGLNKESRSCISTYGSGDIASIKWDNNICYTERDVPFVGFAYQAEPKLSKIEGDGNVFYYSGQNPEKAIPPMWDANSSTEDPELVIDGHYLRRK